MKKLKLLLMVLKRIKADKILIGFVFYIVLSSILFAVFEPGITSFMSGLWYSYSVISTVGFGDIVAVTFIGKILSVLLTMYSIIVIAIITGVVVNFYTEINKFQRKETLAVFMDKLERLPELSEEELEEISKKIKDLR